MTANDRITKLEVSVSSLASGLEAFVAESREYRRTVSETESKIWSALEKSRPNITWPVIVTTCAFLLGVAGALAGLGHMFVELRVKQVEATLDATQRDVTRHERQLDHLMTK